MPAYNMEWYIGRSIESVIAQTYTNWELIIIDDCSTDRTIPVVEEFVKIDNRITVIKNKKNMGVASSRNNGISAAKGEFLAFLDSDDTWDFQKLESQMEMVTSMLFPVLIYSSYDFIDERDNSILKPYIVPKETDFNHMLGENVIGCSSVLVTRSIVSEIGGFPTDTYHEDYALWMKILQQGKNVQVLGITQVLMHHRQLETGRSISKKKAAMNRWRVYRRVLKLGLLKSLMALAKYSINGIKKYK